MASVPTNQAVAAEIAAIIEATETATVTVLRSATGSAVPTIMIATIELVASVAHTTMTARLATVSRSVVTVMTGVASETTAVVSVPSVAASVMTAADTAPMVGLRVMTEADTVQTVLRSVTGSAVPTTMIVMIVPLVASVAHTTVTARQGIVSRSVVTVMTGVASVTTAADTAPIVGLRVMTEADTVQTVLRSAIVSAVPTIMIATIELVASVAHTTMTARPGTVSRSVVTVMTGVASETTAVVSVPIVGLRVMTAVDSVQTMTHAAAGVHVVVGGATAVAKRASSPRRNVSSTRSGRCVVNTTTRSLRNT